MKRLPIVSTIIAFICIVILLKLGFWQLHRAEEKEQIAVQMAEREDSVYPNLMAALNDDGEHNYKPVKITGKVDNQKLLYWDNRVLLGKVGYEVLAILKNDAGNILVNFGWIEDTSFRQSIPLVVIPERLNKEDGILYKPGSNLLIKEPSEIMEKWPRRVQQPDFDLIEKLTNVELLPTIVYLKDNAPLGLKNNFKPITMTSQKHIGYALQWFSLAIACLLVYLVALKKKWKDDRKH